ncbi:CIC11C00000004346 [Sungouiella intermedia]|uniref:CIC11C00000004346 n=1 Tax=Sungouiella intermedia TaxID=45354 RepID=A0A1L0D868_9ASCO|nr:CIC11C00000004346 [[Candida] intermedia]
MAMSVASNSSRKLKSSRRSFIGKFLRKRLLLVSSLSPQSLSIAGSSDISIQAAHNLNIDRRSLQTLARSLDSNAYLDYDTNSIYNHDSGVETDPQDELLDPHDAMLDPHADIFSNDSVEEFALKNQKIDFHGLEPSTTGEDQKEMPWAGLTYEALVFPKLARVARKSNKSPKLLNNLFLAQELRSNPAESVENSDVSDDEDAPDESSLQEEMAQSMNPNEALVMEFSKDGKYLAVAGRDCRITVWQVISSPLSRLQHNNYEAETEKQKEKTKSRSYRFAPVFHLEPVVIFEGHTSTILSLNWSKNNFLISGSMDWTAKLWNVDREECLETFQHDDFVTTVAFHPTDDRFFVSGSLDNCVRLWSIMESSVSFVKNLGDEVLITALSFTPTGSYIIVGGFNGSLFALETNGLHFIHRIEVKEKSIAHPFNHKRNHKITGIRIFENPSAVDVAQSLLQKWNILVTTNDSKIRLIDLGLRKLVTRFKGSSNTSSIVASLTDDDKYIISASEDHWCYVWENNNSIINNKLRTAIKDMYIEGKTQVTEKHKKVVKSFQESKLWKKLNMQHFLDDVNSQTFVANENSSYASFHAHHHKVNAAIFAPETTKKLLEFSDDLIYDLVKRGPSLVRAGIVKPKKTASDLDCGHIIVTCDTTGLIRVFRQDSAFYIRKGLVEFRKTCKSARCADLKPQVSNTLKLDISGLNKKLIKTRSLSPSIDRSLTFKSFHNKLKPNGRNGPSNPNLYLLPRQQSSRSTLVADHPIGSNIASSSPLLNIRDITKTVPGAKEKRLDNVALSFRDYDTPNISDESTTAINVSVNTPMIGVSECTPPRAKSPVPPYSPSAILS